MNFFQRWIVIVTELLHRFNLRRVWVITSHLKQGILWIACPNLGLSPLVSGNHFTFSVYNDIIVSEPKLLTAVLYSFEKYIGLDWFYFIFYHDVGEIFLPQPIRSLKFGHVTGQGPMSPTWVGRVSDPGKNGFHKMYKNFDNIAVYLIASLKSKWKINK